MLHPIRFASGAAHNQRVEALRDIADFTQDELRSATPFRFVRYLYGTDADKRTRRWYVVDFGFGEVALEKGQIELVLLGFVAALGVTDAMSREGVEHRIGALLQAFEEGCAPRPWTA